MPYNAEKVIKILLECDGGCEYCVSSLLKLFSEKFPQYRNLAKEAFRDKFDKELEDFLKHPQKEAQVMENERSK